MPKTVVYCTHCKNRFWQLKQTLRPNMDNVKNDADVRFVVVDFNGDDSDEMVEWIKLNFKPELDSGRLVYYRRNEKGFEWCCAKSKNRTMFYGAELGDILVTLDCDNYIQPDDASLIRSEFINGPVVMQMSNYNKNSVGFIREHNLYVDPKYERMEKDETGDVGRMVFRTEDFTHLGGYDERFGFIGFEDTDLLVRAVKYGLPYVHCTPFPDCRESNIPNEYNQQEKAMFWGNFYKNIEMSRHSVRTNQLQVNPNGREEKDLTYTRIR